MGLTDIGGEVRSLGFTVVEDVITRDEVKRLADALQRIDDASSLRKQGSIFAVRNLLEISPEVCELASSRKLRLLVEPVLGTRFFPVRGILFDKIPEANWKVPWHQDVTIAVQQKIDAEGFEPWSIKADVLHVQPPAVILESMLSLRLHLDDCGEENGALRVIPATHLLGRIPEDQIQTIRDHSPEQICAVASGGALLMRPLLLHASSPSSAPVHRRVIHLDFASVALPNGMRWLSDVA